MIHLRRKACLYRLADRNDASAIFKMCRDFHQETQLKNIVFDDVVFAGHLSWLYDDGACFLAVAEHDGKIVGFMSGWVYQLYFSKTLSAQNNLWYVLPEYRGGMIGVRLLKMFESWAFDKGAKILVGGTSSGISMPRSNKLIEKFGYEPVGSEYRKVL
jgi:GNAT superfamily N-acetyltransferase